MENHPTTPRKKSRWQYLPESVLQSKKTVSHPHDGHVYHLPTPPATRNLLFTELELDFFSSGMNGKRHLACDEHELVALQPDNICTLMCILSGIVKEKDTDSESKPGAFIYRKGLSAPVYYCEFSTVNEDLIVIMAGIELPAGDYFILFEGLEDCASSSCELEYMEGMPTYHFTIKEHGRNLRHPKFIHQQYDKNPVLRLRPASGLLNRCDEFRYVCYNRVYRPVYQHTCTPSVNSLFVTLMDPSTPLDDIYTLVLFHNNEPFQVFRYTLLDRQVHHLTTTDIIDESPIYTLATTVSEHPQMDKFVQEPGFLPVKDYILEVLSDEKEKGHVMAFCPAMPSTDFLEISMELLHGINHYAIIDVAEIAGTWRGKDVVSLQRFLREDGIVLLNLSVLLQPDYAELFTVLDLCMKDSGKCFYLFDRSDVLAQFLSRLNHSADSFAPDHRLMVPDYEPSDLVHLVNVALMKQLYKMDGKSQCRLNDLIIMEEEAFSSLDRSSLEEWVNQCIIPYLKEKYVDEPDFDCVLNLVQIDFSVLPLPNQSGDDYECCLADLYALVGLEHLKSRLTTLFNCAKFDRMRRDMGLPGLNENRYHMIFTGNPGTGKTTVARIMGKVFKELGILSSGEVITVERADLVGKYIGHTEDSMNELLERAKGNVLFIDEAYTLCDSSGGDRSDYGNRVIECLLGVLANNESDMIIIIAGYQKEMNQMLSKNPGLRGRFVYTFHFEDYTEDQLLEICLNKLRAKEFCVEDPVKDVMKSCISRAVASKDALFHNARWAEQFVMQGIVAAMADRLCQSGVQPDYKDLCTVTTTDVQTGYDMTRPSSKPVPRPVGFKNR